MAIRQASIDPAEATVADDIFENSLALKPGGAYSAERVRESMERLYASGRFDDIRVDATEQPGGVVLTFLIRPRYFVGLVRVLGAPSPPTEAALESATELRLGYPYAERNLPAAEARLQQELQDDGYFQARLEHREDRHTATHQMDVWFTVHAGERASLGQVRISGTPVLEENKLLHETDWSPGKSYTSDLIQNGISKLRELYRKQNYLEATLTVGGREYHPESNLVDMEVSITAGAPVEVLVTGAELSMARMQEMLPIFQEGALDEDLLREGDRNLRDYFESRGYFQVKVTHQRTPPGAPRTNIEYTIDLGPRQHLDSIEIRGNRYFQAETLMERLRMETARWRLPYGRFSRAMLQGDADAIGALYRSNGFSEVDVRTTLERTPASSEGILVSFLIQEGPQTIIKNFTLAGNKAFTEDQLAAYINAATGQPYSETMVATDRNNLLTYYRNAGFPHAQFDFQAANSADDRGVNLDYRLEEGDPEAVRHIFVGGLEHTRVGIVNRQLQIQDGQPLGQGQMLESQRRLYDLGLFSRVEMGVQNPGIEEERRNVLLYFDEARRYTLKLGIGAEVGRFGGSSSDGSNVEGSTEFSPDISLDVTRLNFGGRPHTASFRSRFSAIQKRAGIGYSAPRLLNHESLNGSLQAFFDDTHDVTTFTARRWEATLQFEHKRSRIATVIYRYTFRRVTTSDVNISADEIPLQSQPVLVGLVGGSWIRDTRDLAANATTGLLTTVDLAVAAKQFGSEASFVRGLIQNSSYFRVFGNVILARSTQFGVETPFGMARTVTVGVDEKGQPTQTLSTISIPLPERFYAGGGSSHRGFALNQAGPRDLETGFAVGGDALLLNSLELRFPVWGKNISGVLFHDAGNVYTSIRSLSFGLHQKSLTDFDYLSNAVGLGVRYNTAVAPLRFDVGYNLNPTRFLVQTGVNPGEHALSRWQFLFSIGQTF